MDIHEEPQAEAEISLRAQLAQSAAGAALAQYNQDLRELNRLAEGADEDNED